MRLNRLVALAEVRDVQSALLELEALDGELPRDFAPYHAVRADLLRRAGHSLDARRAYDEALSLIASDAERAWLTRQRSLVLVPPC